MKSTPFHRSLRRPVASALHATCALLLLGTLTPAFAKKGGGGKPGGGGEDPPPEPVGDLPHISLTPINYDVRFFIPTDSDDWAGGHKPVWATEPDLDLKLYDINRTGVAVGRIYLPASGTGHGVLATNTHGLEVLDDVFAASLLSATFDGFRITRSTEINADGWVTCTLVHTTMEGLWLAIGNIADEASLKMLDGPLEHIYGPIAADLNESGDVIATESFFGGGRNSSLSYRNWLFAAESSVGGGTEYATPVLLDGVNTSNVSLHPTRLEIAFDSELSAQRLDFISDITTAVPENSIRLVHIDAESAVYTFVKTQDPDRKRGIEGLGYPARWSEAAGMEPLANVASLGTNFEVADVSAAIPTEGDTIEVLMGAGVGPGNYRELAIYRPDGVPGTRFPVEVSGVEIGLWSSLVVNETQAISRPNISGHGLICGHGYDGTVFTRRIGFILTPLTPLTP